MAHLSRSIGTRGLTASLFNTTVGAGIFAMPALVAQVLGASAVYAYLACAMAMLCIVLAFAVAGSRVPRAGGTSAYAEAAFGPLVGFLGGTLNLLSDALGAAAVMAGLSAAIGALVPALDGPVARAAILAAILGTFAWINIRGVRHGTRVVEVMTIAKLAPLLILVAAAALLGGASMWQMGPLPDVATIGRASLVLIFAFSGAESVMALSGEVARPSRTIPVALIIALAMITSLYIAVHLAAVVGLGASLAQTPDATLAVAAGALLGPHGRLLLAVGTVVSMAGLASAAVMTTPRLVFAIARRGLLPPWLARVHPAHQTPAAAIAAQTIVFFLLASSGTFAALAVLASVSVVAVYLLACASALQLQSRGTRLLDGPSSALPAEGELIHVPPVVLGAGAVFCIVLLAQATRVELLMVLVALALATGWYLTHCALGRVTGQGSGLKAQGSRLKAQGSRLRDGFPKAFPGSHLAVEPDVDNVPVPDDPAVGDDRPAGSADVVRDEVLPTVSMPMSVRSVALTVLTAIAATWALYVAQTLVVPLLVGIVVSLVLSPLVEGLRRVRVPRSAGAALVLALLLALLGGVGYQLSGPAADLADELPQVAKRVREALVHTTVDRDSAVANLQEAADELTTAAAATPRDRSGAQPVRVVDPPTRLRDYVMTGTGVAAQVLLVLFLVFFLLSAGDLYKRKFVKLTGPSLSRKKITVQIIDEIRDQIGVYLRTLVLVSSIVGVATWLSYRAVGMPNAAVWGLLAGVANVVPYIGPTLVAGAASAMAFSHFGTVGQALLVGGIQIGITSLEGFLLTPALMSRSARMNPVAMFVGLLFWGWLWGAWGVVLGVPLLMATKVIADRVDDLQGLGELLGD